MGYAVKLFNEPVRPRRQRQGSGPAGRRSLSETGAPRLRASFMLSPEQRLNDTMTQLHVQTAAERRALQEELQNWYFAPNASSDVGAMMPDVEVLEQAIAARAKAVCTG